EPVPRVNEIRGVPCLSVVAGRVYLPPRFTGSGPRLSQGVHQPCASTTASTDSTPASICTQGACTSVFSTTTATPSATRISPPAPTPSSRPSPPSRTTSSSEPSACSAGTGSPTAVLSTTSTSSLDTPST